MHRQLDEHGKIGHINALRASKTPNANTFFEELGAIAHFIDPTQLITYDPRIKVLRQSTAQSMSYEPWLTAWNKEHQILVVPDHYLPNDAPSDSSHRDNTPAATASDPMQILPDIGIDPDRGVEAMGEQRAYATFLRLRFASSSDEVLKDKDTTRSHVLTTPREIVTGQSLLNCVSMQAVSLPEPLRTIVK